MAPNNRMLKAQDVLDQIDKTIAEYGTLMANTLLENIVLYRSAIQALQVARGKIQLL
jgi:hypothetical protein